MGHLTGLPPEILHSIFSLLEPADLGVLPCICKVVRDHVDGNWKLFKDVYLNKFVRNHGKSSHRDYEKLIFLDRIVPRAMMLTGSKSFVTW